MKTLLRILLTVAIFVAPWVLSKAICNLTHTDKITSGIIAIPTILIGLFCFAMSLKKIWGWKDEGRRYNGKFIG